MTRLKYLASGEVAEESIQKAVFDWIKKDPRLKPYRRLIMHFANEGKRSLRYGALMKALGLRPGVSDIFIAPPRHGFGGAWIELKSVGGVVSKAQKEFLDDMRLCNYYTRVCWSIDEAMEIISWYLGI